MSNNNNNYQRPSFQELKSRVGIDDIAYALGYKLDRRAGIGRYYELVLMNGNEKRDTLVVRNTPNKASQTFFRRDGSFGDVVTLVRDNLSSFNADGSNEWAKITNVLSKFACMPQQNYRKDLETLTASRGSAPFDPNRYDVRNIEQGRIPELFKQRGLSDETVLKFKPFIRLVSDRNNRNFKGYNVGFPYTSKCQDDIAGYEIRGYNGFKSKAAGTNSSTAAWIADFSNDNPHTVENVYFFESAFDAMSFYQLNEARLDKNCVLVSLGGSFSNGQVLSVIDRFPNARLNDCFDNDLAGRINGLRLLSVAEQLPMKVTNFDGVLQVEAKGKKFELTLEKPLYVEIGQFLPLRYKLGQSLPPKNFKDWNDCLMGKHIAPDLSPDKHDRNIHLAEQRKSSLKL